MKRLIIAGTLLMLPLVLVACEPASNANVTTIDLTNTTVANTNVAAANANVLTNVNSAANTNAATNVNATANANTSAKVAATAVTITASGFSPASVIVKAGTTVTWTNTSGSEAKIASDPHPTHTDLPGLESETLVQGATFSFTFTQVGTWGYHDHFSPTTRGTIIVQ